MTKPIELIKAAFSPARAVQDPRRFVGRKTSIKTAILGLQEPGAMLAIYGRRGVGKTSVANQVGRIAEGASDLTEELGLEPFMPSESFNMMVHNVTADHAVKNMADLCNRLLFGDDRNQGLVDRTASRGARLSKATAGVKAKKAFGVPGNSAEMELSGQAEFTFPHADEAVTMFKQALGQVKRDNPNSDGLLVIIDEFDIIEDKKGFASLVKGSDPDFITFCIVGIAEDIGRLLEDHHSIGRQINTCEVKPMQPDELVAILDRAEEIMERQMYFTDDAKRLIAKLSEGYPFFTHLLGRECCLALIETSEPNNWCVNEKAVEVVLAKLAAGQIGTIYEAMYQKAVKQSAQRELLLKCFSDQNDDEIETTEVYETVKAMGVSNPSQLMKELTAPQDGGEGVLRQVRDRCYTFKDPVFKVYARIRNFKFKGN